MTKHEIIGSNAVGFEPGCTHCRSERFHKGHGPVAPTLPAIPHLLTSHPKHSLGQLPSVGLDANSYFLNSNQTMLGFLLQWTFVFYILRKLPL